MIKNNKRVVISIILLILLLILLAVLIVNHNKKNIYIDNIDKQVKELFCPVIDNTSFIVNDDRFLLTFDDAKFSKMKDRYFTRLENDVIVEFSIYKNEVSRNHFITKGTYSPRTKRDSYNSRLYIVNSKRYSNIISLVDEFYYRYYNSYLEESGVTECEVSTEYDYSNVSYDDKGNLIQSGTVFLQSNFTSKSLKAKFYSEFEMVADGDSIEIPIIIEMIDN